MARMEVPLLDRARGDIRLRYETYGGVTRPLHLFETGGLRMRHPRAQQGCVGVMVNSAGCILGGDHLSLAIEAGEKAEVAVTTLAAEKIHRTLEAPALLDLSFTLAGRSTLSFLPQETIFFDASALKRRLNVVMAEDAAVLLVDMIVLGRLASGEDAITCRWSDSWRIHRGGRLIFAEESRMNGAVRGYFDQPSLGGGGRAIALLLAVAPDAEGRLDALRDRLAPFKSVCAYGVSAWNGMLVARFLAASPDILRKVLTAGIGLWREDASRLWQ